MITCNSMTCFRLYKYAKDTREAQRKYFRTRTQMDLRESKAMERRLDEAIEAYERAHQPPAVQAGIEQPDLFPAEGELRHD